MNIAFKVLGTPVAQGSMRHVGRGRVVHSNAAALLPWRDSVRAAAAAAMGGRELELGPVFVVAEFGFPRPKGHYGTGRNCCTVRPSAPICHSQAPDIDKLLRAVLDSMTGVVFRDDSQVHGSHLSKWWAQAGGCGYVEVRVQSQKTCEVAP